MGKKLIGLFIVLLILLQASSCVVTTPYDRHSSRLPRPHAMMRRPHAVKSSSRYSWSWNPFGYSSSQSREHWPRHHGERINRVKNWPHKYVPHPHFYKVKYYR